MELTTREVSILVWSVAFLAWVLTHANVRASVGSLLRIALSRTLVFFVLTLGAYAVAEVYLLWLLGAWTPALMKETMLWFGLTAVSSAGASMAVSEDIDLSKPLWDSLRIMVLLELLVGKITFPLPVELILVPLATMFGILCVVAELKHNGQPVHVFLRRVQALFGFTILAAVVHRAFQNPQLLANHAVMAEYLNAPILLVLFIPALYLCNVYSRYE